MWSQVVFPIAAKPHPRLARGVSWLGSWLEAMWFIRGLVVTKLIPMRGLKPAATRVEGNRVSQGLETQDVAEVNVK